MGALPEARWVAGRQGDTPAAIRQRALGRIVNEHDAVVLVDADDVMHPTRVSTAREMLGASDFVACALRIVDEHGASLDAAFTLPPGLNAEDVFPRTNAFGLSNSAVRCDLLRTCLPIPVAAIMVDWYLATRAWLRGARMAFTPQVEMDYRQYGSNTARVMGPYGEKQVIEDTERVRGHFDLVQASLPADALPDRVTQLKSAAADVEAFHGRVVLKPEVLARYLRALNGQTSPPLWWSWVANAALRHLWTDEGELA
jgi:hypothetical protein